MASNGSVAPRQRVRAASADRTPPATVPTVGPKRRGTSPHKTELTRYEIVNAALAEFLEAGIANATMDRIAKRAGLAKGTLYLYFSSKEALLAGALEATVAFSALSSIDHPRAPDETVRAYIARLLIPSMVNLHASGRLEFTRLMLGEARRHPELAQFYRERVYTPWHLHFEHLLQIAVDEGELSGIAPKHASLLLGAPLWVSLVYGTVAGTAQDPDCSPAALMRAQIDAIFGRHGEPYAIAAPTGCSAA